MKLSDDFKTQLKEAYKSDEQWTRIIQMFNTLSQTDQNQEYSSEVPRIDFQMENELIYYEGPSGKQRLCIPRTIEQEIFKLAHDQ